MLGRESANLPQRGGDTAAMALTIIALVAQQADCRTGTRNRKKLVERLLRSGGLQMFIVDAPERIEVACAGGLPPFRGRSERAQVQVSDVVVVRTAPVAVFVAVTVAAETTAPDESVTVPVIVPRSLCPNTGNAQALAVSSHAAVATFQDFIRHPNQARSEELEQNTTNCLPLNRAHNVNVYITHALSGKILLQNWLVKIFCDRKAQLRHLSQDAKFATARSHL